jgi:hypothetical protein
MLIPLTLSAWLRPIAADLPSSAMIGQWLRILRRREDIYHSTQALLVEIRRPAGLAGFVSSPILGDLIATDVVWKVWNMEAFCSKKRVERVATAPWVEDAVNSLTSLQHDQKRLWGVIETSINSGGQCEERHTIAKGACAGFPRFCLPYPYYRRYYIPAPPCNGPWKVH